MRPAGRRAGVATAREQPAASGGPGRPVASQCYGPAIPANRRGVDKETKRNELLDAAEELFLADGYEQTGVVAVAKAAGVTANTLYWYFPSKDHLFAAVLERWIAYALGVVDKQAELGPPVQVVRVIANVYKELQPLLATIHERAAFVEVLAGLHDILHLGLRAPLVTALQQVYEQPADAEAAADLLLVVFEGAHAHAYADPKEGLVETAIGLLAQ